MSEKSTGTPILAPICACLVLLLAAPVLAAESGQNTNCEKKRQVRVSGSESLVSDQSYRTTRDFLLRSLLVEAATIVNGAEITSRRASELRAVNEDLSAVIASYDAVKSQGLIASYSFPIDGETVTETDIGAMLRLALDVMVCDHSDLAPRVYINVGEIKFTNFRQVEKDLVAVVAGAIPGESNLTYVSSDTGNQYYDYVVSGQILSVAATVEKNRWLEALGQTVTASGQPIVDSRRHRLSAIIEMHAYNVTEDTYTLIHRTVEKSIPIKSYEGALAQRIDEFIVEALGTASHELYEKIIAQKDFHRARKRQ